MESCLATFCFWCQISEVEFVFYACFAAGLGCTKKVHALPELPSKSNVLFAGVPLELSALIISLPTSPPKTLATKIKALQDERKALMAEVAQLRRELAMSGGSGAAPCRDRRCRRCAPIYRCGC